MDTHTHTPAHTHTPFMPTFSYTLEEKGSSVSHTGEVWQGEETEEPSLTWGPSAQSPILCSSMWKMAREQEEEGKEAKKKKVEERGGGCNN